MKFTLIKHKTTYGLGIDIGKGGLWLQIWNRTLYWQCKPSGSMFGAGFGISRGLPYMEIGRTSWDVRADGKLTKETLSF